MELKLPWFYRNYVFDVLTGAAQKTDYFPGIFRNVSYVRFPLEVWIESTKGVQDTGASMREHPFAAIDELTWVRLVMMESHGFCQ